MKDQMQEKVQKAMEARQLYESEKAHVDQQVKKLIEDEKQLSLLEQASKEHNYQVMVETLAQKEERLRREKLREKMENQRVLQFQQLKDEQLESLKLKKAEEDVIRRERGYENYICIWEI